MRGVCWRKASGERHTKFQGLFFIPLCLYVLEGALGKKKQNTNAYRNTELLKLENLHEELV